MRRSACYCILCALAAALLALFAATPQGRAADEPLSFIRDVAPIIKERCLACHDARKRSGKYEMGTFEKLMAGGTNGEAIIPGKPEESDFHGLMVTKDDRRMPPKDKGEAVPKDKIEIVAKWIKSGAKLDAGLDPKADLVRELRKRWSPPAPPEKYPFPSVINALCFTPDGKRIVVGGQFEVTIWDAQTGKLTTRLRTRAERAYALAFLNDGTLAVAGGRPGQEGDVTVYDLTAKPVQTKEGVAFLDGVSDSSAKIAKLFEGDDSQLCLAVSQDGKQLAAGGTDRTVRVWSVAEGARKAKLEQTIENHADWVLGVAFSPDGKKLFSTGRDKLAKVWDLEKKESIQSMPDHQAIVYGVVVKPDGSSGYSVGADKLLRNWKVGGDGKVLKNGGGHGDDVFKISLTKDGKTLATASADKTVRLWDTEKLAVQKTLSGLTDYVFAVGFSPDGTRVAGGGYDGTVQIWSVADGKPVVSFKASPGLK
ncbi:MAG: c-type cytochrome domain-containing protein [Gemmataceae bacterium]